MADIELVIKIPEEAKRAFDNAENNELKCGFYDHGGVIGSAIRNGTELPKGHKELIDTKELIQDFVKAGENMKDNGVTPVFDVHEITNMILAQNVIVDADKGEDK